MALLKWTREDLIKLEAYNSLSDAGKLIKSKLYFLRERRKVDDELSVIGQLLKAGNDKATLTAMRRFLSDDYLQFSEMRRDCFAQIESGLLKEANEIAPKFKRRLNREGKKSA
jgi:hypothetical protein